MDPAGETPAAVAAKSDARELPRVLGPLSAASILIGSIIGSGIFKKPSEVAAALPSPGWILVVWAAAGFLSLIGSLVFAELGSYYPKAGGQYTFIHESFGRLPAFLFGWTNLLIINSASIAALAIISAESLCGLLGGASAAVHQLVAVVLIALLTAANMAGVRWGAGIQNALTILKLGAIGLIILGVLVPGKASWGNLSPFWELRGSPTTEAIASGFKAAFLAIFWAYDGWYLLSFSCGEIRNPRRNIPIGFILGILVVIGAYVAASIAYFTVIPLEEMASFPKGGIVGSAAAERFYGPIGLTLIAIGIMGSTLGAANGNLLTGPRLSFQMARDGVFFRSMGGVHARFLTPFLAIALQGVIGAAYVYAGNFNQLTDSVVFAAWVFYLLAILGYFRLRARNAGRTDVFRSPGFPVLPALFVGFAALFLAYNFYESGMLVSRFLSNPADQKAQDAMYILISTGIILLGLPAYWFFRRQGRGSAD
jgi:amino acid transporter